MRELKVQEVEEVSGGFNPISFILGAAAGSQIGRITDYVVDDIIKGFQSPVIIHPHQDGRAF